MKYAGPPKFDDPDEGIWAIVLGLSKPLMLILISIFAILGFVTAIELEKLGSSVVTPFSELTACSIMVIPGLITLIGFYATYHMHKSIMIIVSIAASYRELNSFNSGPKSNPFVTHAHIVLRSCHFARLILCLLHDFCSKWFEFWGSTNRTCS